jgi:hypothetical protein
MSFVTLKKRFIGQAQWLTPVIPVTQEVEIGTVQNQPRQKVSKTTISTNKPGHGSTCLWSQLHKKPKEED